MHHGWSTKWPTNIVQISLLINHSNPQQQLMIQALAQCQKSFLFFLKNMGRCSISFKKPFWLRITHYFLIICLFIFILGILYVPCIMTLQKEERLNKVLFNRWLICNLLVSVESAIGLISQEAGQEAESAHMDQLAQNHKWELLPCSTTKKGKSTLPTQALTCSGSKGLSQPALPTSWPIG